MRQRLLGELLGDQPHPLASHLESWLGSRRFADFAREHLPKIRKKLKAAYEPETARDLLLELETAYSLVKDKRLTLVYEPTPGGSARGPDFSVRFTTRLSLMLEVTRLRGQAVAGPSNGYYPGIGAPEGEFDAQRLAGVLGPKLRQVVPNSQNVLLIGTDGPLPDDAELTDHLAFLRQTAETSPPEAFEKRGFRSRGDYLRRLDLLSAVILRRAPRLEKVGVAPEGAVWANPNARMPLPNDVRSALLNALLI